MNLEVLTPDKSLFKGKAKSISVPGKKGNFMILNNHAPIISTLSKGDIQILTTDFEEQTITITGGIVEVKHNKIIVLADVV